MKDLIEKKDFEIINIMDETPLLFYTPFSHIFPLTHSELGEYFAICKNPALLESSFIGKNDLNGIYEFLIDKFNTSAPPFIVNDAPPQQLQTLIFPIAGNCNLECKYCFARVDGNFGFKDVDIEGAKKIIDYLCIEQNYSNFNINFFGGEPFLNFEVFKFVIEYINANFQDQNISFSATTNGTILDKYLDFIKKHDIALLVSIDGPIDVNKHRVYKNGRNSFYETYSNILKCKEMDINISLRATIANDSIKILETYEFFEELEIPFNIVFAYESENKNHSLANYSDNILIVQKQLDLLIGYYLNLIEQNKTIYCQSLMDRLFTIAQRKNSFYACSGGHSMFSITSDGDIYTCEHLVGNRKYSTGNIFSQDGLMHSSSIRAINVEEIKDCQICWARYICSGGCFSNNISTTGDIFQPEKGKCELMKVEWRFVIALYYCINKKFPLFFKNEKNIKDEVINC